MSRNSLALLAAALLVAAPGCIVAGVPLDEATIAMEILLGESTAEITADLSDSGGALDPDEDQTVSVNDLLLTERRTGRLEGELPLAFSYEIEVREPTRGVLRETIDAPAELEITAPADGGDASLSGFTLTWPTLADAEVTIRLRQTLLGETATETFGPMDDTGSQMFSAADLADFRQGGDIEITIERTTMPVTIAGVSDWSLTFTQTAEGSVNPTP